MLLVYLILYVMNVLWYIQMVLGSLDSLSEKKKELSTLLLDNNVFQRVCHRC